MFVDIKHVGQITDGILQTIQNKTVPEYYRLSLDRSRNPILTMIPHPLDPHVVGVNSSVRKQVSFQNNQETCK